MDCHFEIQDFLSIEYPDNPDYKTSEI